MPWSRFAVFVVDQSALHVLWPLRARRRQPRGAFDQQHFLCVPSVFDGDPAYRPAADGVARVLDHDVLSGAGHLAHPDAFDRPHRHLPLLLLRLTLLTASQRQFGKHCFAEFHYLPSPFSSRQPLVRCHPVLAHAELVDAEDCILQCPLHYGEILVDDCVQPGLEADLDRAQLGRHVLHSLLARSVGLWVVGWRISRHGTTVT